MRWHFPVADFCVSGCVHASTIFSRRKLIICCLIVIAMQHLVHSIYNDERARPMLAFIVTGLGRLLPNVLFFVTRYGQPYEAADVYHTHTPMR